MQNSNTKMMIIGGVLVVGGWALDGQIRAAGGDNAYYAMLIIGAALLAFGAFKNMSAGSVDDTLSEEEIANGALLKTLARMTDADTNIMQIEVDSVCAVYKDLTGSDVTSADVRVAAKGDLYEDAPFKKYLRDVSGRISTSHKKRIMSGLAKVMESDGVVNPLEVEFFNEVGECLELTPHDLAEIKGAADAS